MSGELIASDTGYLPVGGEDDEDLAWMSMIKANHSLPQQ